MRVCQRDRSVTLTAWRSADGRGLYKVWIRGRGGRMLVGTLIPEGTGLQAKRTFSISELERAGCWPVEGAQAVLAFPFEQKAQWYCEEHPGRLVQDEELRQQLEKPILCKREADKFHFAAPFRGDTPMRIEILACLGHMGKIDGKSYLIRDFDREGRPIVPGEIQ